MSEELFVEIMAGWAALLFSPVWLPGMFGVAVFRLFYKFLIIKTEPK